MDFVEADAASHAFKPNFDLLFSRFGVMFFADPVAAFTNLHSALKPGGRLCFNCWQAMTENPWLAAPMGAAQPFLPEADPPAEALRRDRKVRRRRHDRVGRRR